LAVFKQVSVSAKININQRLFINTFFVIFGWIIIYQGQYKTIARLYEVSLEMDNFQHAVPGLSVSFCRDLKTFLFHSVHRHQDTD